MVKILCEGPKCNKGLGAEDRMARHLPKRPTDDDYRQARSAVTQELVVGGYHPHHVQAGDDRSYKCLDCGHVRIYGG